ncbi:MAG: methionine--tRNA ligase [Candidatus Parvarchaeota archaeon]|nr:methionine--tRNA ligase [Candidatus Parvarchaeota archaeon]MCW1294716.1 methionine--tRNA ligase [Candidatus Parvarchaeum tengchongense]MCW1295047.1 methionine--tRNA ligase [Candidatus Parvarchaeum tengchongense]MCW1312796.1 methionine--tRNA ligase [Candidatus Parvarchaeum tengchongense]
MEKFYVTTPIYYVNDKPHIGHAYTTIIADVLARWHRLNNEKVFFLTGTDEHGGKIEKAAAEKHKTPKELVDENSQRYKAAWEKLNISYDKFIRTTDEYHESAVKEFIKKVWNKGDIYKDEYEGFYCLPDERYITETELVNGKCPDCGRDVQKIKEEAYFFRLSKYKEQIVKLIKNGLIIPEKNANEILSRLNGELKDLDITRKSVSWGIKFPFDESHSVYVWFDALLNYLSALNWPDGSEFKEFWPADVHLVGKEIVWFHSVIWPAMLLSADLPVPKNVMAHGWWTVEGRKMSKSLGNVVDPIEMVDKYSADAFRYFLIREKPTWEDGDFSESALKERINGELMANLSNLVARILTIAERFEGKIEGNPEIEDFIKKQEIIEKFEKKDLYSALNLIFDSIRKINKYVNDKEPWKLQGKELANVLYNSLEAIRVIAIFLKPFMPSTAEKIEKKLGIKEQLLSDAVFREFTTKVERGENLFNKVI